MGGGGAVKGDKGVERWSRRRRRGGGLRGDGVEKEVELDEINVEGWQRFKRRAVGGS